MALATRARKVWRFLARLCQVCIAWKTIGSLQRRGSCITNQRADPRSKRNYYLLITRTFMVVEVVGGLLTGSVTLLSDTG